MKRPVFVSLISLVLFIISTLCLILVSISFMYVEKQSIPEIIGSISGIVILYASAIASWKGYRLGWWCLGVIQVSLFLSSVFDVALQISGGNLINSILANILNMGFSIFLVIYLFKPRLREYFKVQNYSIAKSLCIFSGISILLNILYLYMKK